MEADIKVALDRGEDAAAMEPLQVSESAPGRENLTELAMELAAKSAGFSRSLPDGVITALAELVRSMNCYYSNLIEGHDTHPVDIERALQNDYSDKKHAINSTWWPATCHAEATWTAAEVAAKRHSQNSPSSSFRRVSTRSLSWSSLLSLPSCASVSASGSRRKCAQVACHPKPAMSWMRFYTEVNCPAVMCPTLWEPVKDRQDGSFPRYWIEEYCNRPAPERH